MHNRTDLSRSRPHTALRQLTQTSQSFEAAHTDLAKLWDSSHRPHTALRQLTQTSQSLETAHADLTKLWDTSHRRHKALRQLKQTSQSRMCELSPACTAILSFTYYWCTTKQASIYSVISAITMDCKYILRGSLASTESHPQRWAV